MIEADFIILFITKTLSRNIIDLAIKLKQGYNKNIIPVYLDEADKQSLPQLGPLQSVLASTKDKKWIPCVMKAISRLPSGNC